MLSRSRKPDWKGSKRLFAACAQKGSTCLRRFSDNRWVRDWPTFIYISGIQMRFLRNPFVNVAVFRCTGTEPGASDAFSDVTQASFQQNSRETSPWPRTKSPFNVVQQNTPNTINNHGAVFQLVRQLLQHTCLFVLGKMNIKLEMLNGLCNLREIIHIDFTHTNF